MTLVAMLEHWCIAAMDAHPRAVADYRNGKSKAINVLIGWVMKHAPDENPDEVRLCLELRLSAT